MKFLSESFEQVEYITEDDEKGNKKYFIEGIFAQAEIANKNKRIYPIHVLEKEVNRFIKEDVSNNRAYGELSHPQTPSINLDRVAMHIKSIKKEGNNFVGKGLIASTPIGSIVKSLINDGAQLGVSTRALGSLKPGRNGLNEVQDDLHLLAIDIVSSPSAPDAYVSAVMEEKSYVWDAARGVYLEEYLDNTKKDLKKMSIWDINSQKAIMFEHFLSKLSRYNI